MADERPNEIIKRDLATKTVYFYRDPRNEFEVKSKEIYKKKKMVVHFPFNIKNGNQKYRAIQEIRYIDLSEPLPAGFLKSANNGYGFTRELAPLLYTLQEECPHVRRVTVSPNEKTHWVSNSNIHFNLSDLHNARPRIASALERHREEQKTLANNILAELLPPQFKAAKAKYAKGQLNELVRTYSLQMSSFSDEDIKSVIKIVRMIPASHMLVKSGEFLATKESVDKVFLEDVIARYEKLLALKTDSNRLEDRWQEFFSKNILYFNFGYVARFEKERIQGDKKLNIPDFIMLNTFRYLDVFEIKTHLSQLLGYDEGRNNFYWTSEAAKAISQAENYIDSMIVNEDTIIKNIRDEYDIHNIDAVRPKVYVIASCRSRIAGPDTSDKYVGKVRKKLWNDFRRLNASLSRIEIVLYDELLGVFKNTLTRLGAAVNFD